MIEKTKYNESNPIFQQHDPSQQRNFKNILYNIQQTLDKVRKISEKMYKQGSQNFMFWNYLKQERNYYL